MKYVYKNISGLDAVTLISGVDIGTASTKESDRIIVNKCRITNTYSSAITVDVYIQAVDVAATETLYGLNAIDDPTEFVTNEYYYIKDVVIPTGVSLNVFGDSACTYTRKYLLKIQLGTSNDTADVATEYEILQGTPTTTTGRRTLNQY